MASAEAEWCGFGGLIRAEVVLGKLPMGFVALRCEYNAISTSVCVYDQHVGPVWLEIKRINIKRLLFS